MERSAFSRARQFLDYSAVAKWTALISSVLTGVLFVALLVLLALFVELLTNQGEIPCFENLPPWEKSAFIQHIIEESKAPAELNQQIKTELKSFGLQDSAVAQSALSATKKSTQRELELQRELLWFLTLPKFLDDAVGKAAGDIVREKIKSNIDSFGLEIALNHNLKDAGILSLVVRSRSRIQGIFVGPTARWNRWLWAACNNTYLIGLFVFALVLALIRTGLTFLSDFMAARATIDAVVRLRRAVYHHTYRLGTLAFHSLGPSEAVSVSTRHLEAVHDGLYTWLTVTFREPVKFGLLFLFALAVNFSMAVAFFLAAVLIWMVGGQIAAYFRTRGRNADRRAADQMAQIQESLMIMRLVKVYSMEPFNQKRVERQLAGYGQSQLERYRGESFYKPMMIGLGLVTALALLLIGGYVILNGGLAATNAAVLATALVSLFWPLVNWLEHRKQMRRARSSAKNLFEFLDRPHDVGQSLDAEFLPGLSKRIEFDDVSLKDSLGGRTLLRNLNLTIQAGQRVALVGPSDLEKHAFVYMLPRLFDPTEGEIRFDRTNLRNVTFESLRDQIALVMQHNLVFNDTVANNIGCGDSSFTLPKIMEAAKTAHAHHFIQKLPKGYETVIGDMGHTLTIGQKFRIALARAILRDPALIIIEEPMMTLDDDTKDLVDDTYNRFLPGRTTIFLPHRLPTIRHCDYVYLLYRGQIEAAGEHRELLSASDLYKHLQYLEFNEFAGVLDRSMLADWAG